MEINDLRECTLKKVKITGDVIGKFGNFEIEQVYKNKTGKVLEVEYVFPIVDTATVTGFEITVGDKVIKGKCKDKNEAKKDYAENLVKGNSAYLLEQSANSIFKISVGKIDINEEVKVKIKYIDKFEIIDNVIKILLPTLVTPKYKSFTSFLPFANVNYTVDFNINIDKSVNVKNIDSPSHNIKIINDENQIIVKAEKYNLSKDFILNVELKQESISNAIKSNTLDGNEIIYLSFMPEILDSYEDSEKEYIFLMDISGSMYGRKLQETKNAVLKCLKQLDVGDKFNIVAFQSTFETMSINSIEYNNENIKRAEEYINSLEVRGGTEILNPIKFALYEEDKEKVVLLFTDGQVGNEDEIINFVRENINKSRIFTFGIDLNVNSYFIRKLAKVGNGKSEMIQPGEKIDDKIIRTFARIQSPLLEDIQIDYGNNKLIDEIKEDEALFNLEYYNVFAKVEKLEDDITLKGKILNKEYEWKIKKNSIKEANLNLETIFEKLKIDSIEEFIANSRDYEKINIYKKMIIDIAEKYNINSKYTAFVSIYERDNKIFEVPQYEQTVLSNESFEMASVNKSASMRSEVFSISSVLAQYELNRKLIDYYNVFITSVNKSIRTSVLYLALIVNNYRTFIDIDELIEYLDKNKEKLQDDFCQKILISSYKKLNVEQKEKIYSWLEKDYRKAADTGLEIKVNSKIQSQDVDKLVDDQYFKENLDELLLYQLNINKSILNR